MALSALGGESRADSDCTHLDALDTPPGKLTWPALRLRILPDPERRLSFAEVSALPLTAFTPTGNPVTPSYHDGRYWLRFCLKRENDTVPASWVLSVLPPYLTHVDLHEHTPDGWKTRRLGAALP
ncbi:MAG: 7TM-DISM domain-containing protein, partial [Halothiobacillaceae bacterium]|nr:7TM-DISM domain-containing protein [Halothiobacillaceae bacterium]